VVVHVRASSKVSDPPVGIPAAAALHTSIGLDDELSSIARVNSGLTCS
jgi:hypothetical protein